MIAAMSACIISLKLIGIEPRSMHEWIDTNLEGTSIKLDTANKNIARQEMLENIQARFETVMWKIVTPGRATGRIEKVHAWPRASKEVTQF